MNTAVLQGTIMATTSHGIHRINRHANDRCHGRPPRMANYFTAIKNEYANSLQGRASLDTDNPNGTSQYNSVTTEISTSDVLSVSKAMGIVTNSKGTDALLNINVGGVRFIFRRLSSLAALPHEKRVPLVDAYFEDTNEYYYERQPFAFHIVYQFYLIGRIHQPSQTCPQDVLDELEFWGINPEPYFAPCCCFEEESDAHDEPEEESDSDKFNQFRNLRFANIRRSVWMVIEEPTSSCYAQIFAFLSVMFVLISISGLVLGSIPDLQVPAKRSAKNMTSNVVLEKDPHPILVRLEYICIVWFSLEYTSKMLVSADRWNTFRQILNIIDFFAILPFIIEMTMLIFGIDTEQLQDLKGALLVIRILRVLRVIRVLKLGRYSSGLQMFGKTLQASFRQLGMMAMVVMTGVIFFSTLVYFLEKDEPDTGFYSIPAACWFTIATMTTVGYGDLTPVTVPGKLVATGAIACGVLVLALPITIIVDNFMKVAESERRPGFTENAGMKRLGPRARIAVPQEATSQSKRDSRRRLAATASASRTTIDKTSETMLEKTSA
uniref:BTB domain-containing protein n=1 Tax=Panagrellus redivivus TaxID=6233 RepID=A0A7E4ZQ30_PANRE